MSDSEAPVEQKSRKKYAMTDAARKQRASAAKAQRAQAKEHKELVSTFLDMMKQNKSKKKPETSDEEDDEETEVEDVPAGEVEDIVIAKASGGRGKARVAKPKNEPKPRGRPRKTPVVEDDAAVWQREYYKLKTQKLLAEQGSETKSKGRKKKEEVEEDDEQEQPKPKSRGKAKAAAQPQPTGAMPPSVLSQMHQKYIGLIQTG